LGALALLFWTSDGDASWLRSYAVLSVCIPLVLLPVQAHFFGMADGFSCVHAVALTWIWGVVWIPLGFAAPWLWGSALTPLNSLFDAFMHWVVGAPSVPVPMIRLQFWEAVGAVCLVLSALLKFAQSCFQRFALKLAAPCVDFMPKSVLNK
jgi:hypothetical protein